MPQRLGQEFRVFHRLNKVIETLGQAVVQGRQDTGSKIKEFKNPEGAVGQFCPGLTKGLGQDFPVTRACPLPSAILGNLGHGQICPGLATGLGQDFPEICKIFHL